MSEEIQILEQQSVQLRKELKAWEKQFFSDSGGRKAGRDDIRADDGIAGKYKAFQRIRDIISGKAGSQKASSPTKKRNSDEDIISTPRKRAKAVDGNTQKLEDFEDVTLLPTTEHSTPVVKRTMIGPTPQKDGQILGIFDLLPNETPSKLRMILGHVHANVTRTPGKAGGILKDDTMLEERARGNRTPASIGKRFLLDAFVTPSKRKFPGVKTPNSSEKRIATPAFLRRDNFVLSTVAEEPQSPEAVRPWRQRSFGRSLSGMIQDLRKQEDEQADDEWETMREMEEGSAPAKAAASNVLVEDSQRAVVLDAEGFVPSETEGVEDESQPQLDRNGQPRKAWKKCGLKRQTRRVKMLPALHKAPEPDAEQGQEQSEEEDEVEVNDDTVKRQTTEKATATVKNPIKKARPKEQANFVKLKIKNQNTQGKKGRGRFGRKKR